MSNERLKIQYNLSNADDYANFVAGIDASKPYIAPEHKLKEQGELLYTYICRGNDRISEKPIPQDALHNSLFDAAFKCSFGRYGDTALHQAVESADQRTVDHLLEMATPEQAFIQNDEGNTALHYAVSMGKHKTIKKLLEMAKDTPELAFLQNHVSDTAKYIPDYSALHTAVMKDDTDTIKHFIKLAKERTDLIFTKTSNGDTPLHLAVNSRNEESIKILLDVASSKQVFIRNGVNDNALGLAIRGRLSDDIIRAIAQKADSVDLLEEYKKNKVVKEVITEKLAAAVTGAGQVAPPAAQGDEQHRG